MIRRAGGNSQAPGPRPQTLVVAALLAAPAVANASDLGTALPPWSVLPFAGILLSIALFPLAAPRFWHKHFGKVAAFWALLFAVPFLLAYRGAAAESILHVAVVDYVPFLILLWGLFTVSGGMIVRGTLKGTPLVNALLLVIGTALASWVGTTGASMLLIRPVLRANAGRAHQAHVVVFFIFLVSNIGGSLTPMGDPPLFLGFLHGVPFFWTLRLLPVTALTAAIVLAAFYTIDRYYFSKEERKPIVEERDDDTIETVVPLRIDGLHNLLFLAGIVGAVLLSGVADLGEVNLAGVVVAVQDLLRDGVILAMGALSLATTPRKVLADNGFSWGPIREVAILFAGIFMTIIPALAILRAGTRGAFGGLMASVTEPAHYFWAAGGLSSFLDNAPTYLTFFNSALGRFYPGTPEAEAVTRLLAEHPLHLVAVSAGAVFMGANTYIGNAPNFMVRSMAEEAGVAMPSFFGYMLRWSIPVLIPTFLLVTAVFFRQGGG
jgi:Na+/H+ antiporter NhaD/arsenite permease-like protein